MTLKEMREAVGLTQHYVAEILNIDQSTVCLWEIGKTNPRMKLIPKISELYKQSVIDVTNACIGEVKTEDSR